MDWFTVDKAGLAKLIDKRGKAFAIFELIQNAWDTRAENVRVTITPLAGKPYAVVEVEDDDPEGFSKLSHAFTLFAESEKKQHADKRGRFNLGEKLVLSLCTEAEIRTTKGVVTFDKDGRSSSNQFAACRERGSIFKGTMRMTRAEYEEVIAAVQTLLPPATNVTTVNGAPLAPRVAVRTFECTLPTEIGDDDGYMRKSARKTTVSLHEVREGEVASIYEMGIPVVETGDKWHVNVHQRVPLNIDRDNVTPAYLRELRTYVLNEAFALVRGEDDATAAWVRDAAGDPRVAPEAFKAVFKERFGDKPVVYDPTDLEGNKLATSRGYNVISGGALSAGEWKNVRATGAALPAGQVTPSPKPFSPDGSPLKMIPYDRWSDAMRDIARFASALGSEVLDAPVSVEIANDVGWPFAACFGKRRLTFNAGRLGHAWFGRGRRDPDVLRLVIHELAHHYASDHLSREYHDALCKVGARVAIVALEQPELFETDGACRHASREGEPADAAIPNTPMLVADPSPLLASMSASLGALDEAVEQVHGETAAPPTASGEASTSPSPTDAAPEDCPACGGHGYRYVKAPPTYESVETKCGACKGSGAKSSDVTVDPKPRTRRR